jgi:TPR repeat protein
MGNGIIIDMKRRSNIKNCMRQFALCYESGRGVPKDFAKAVSRGQRRLK